MAQSSKDCSRNFSGRKVRMSMIHRNKSQSQTIAETTSKTEAFTRNKPVNGAIYNNKNGNAT